MKSNKTQDTIFSLGTQYTAWLMSMLLVFSSIAPSWAGVPLKPRTVQKGSAALTGKSISVNAPRALEGALTRTVTSAVVARSAQMPGLAVEATLQKIQAASAQAPGQFKGLVQIYKETQQLIKQDTPQAREAVRTQLANVLNLTEKTLVDVEQTPVAQSPYFGKAKQLFNQAKEVFQMEKADAKANLEKLYQSAHDLYTEMFNDPQLQPAFARVNTMMPQGTRMLTPEELFGNTKNASLQRITDVASMGWALVTVGSLFGIGVTVLSATTDTENMIGVGVVVIFITFIIGMILLISEEHK